MYDKATLREAPPGVVERWFLRSKAGLQVRPEVTQFVRFRHHNLRTDPPPATGSLDLVLCRYLAFTYYSGRRRLAAAEKLLESLRPGGVLMIGRKEGLGPEELARFLPWPGLPGFFRKPTE